MGFGEALFGCERTGVWIVHVDFLCLRFAFLIQVRRDRSVAAVEQRTLFATVGLTVEARMVALFSIVNDPVPAKRGDRRLRGRRCFDRTPWVTVGFSDAINCQYARRPNRPDKREHQEAERGRDEPQEGGVFGMHQI